MEAALEVTLGRLGTHLGVYVQFCAVSSSGAVCEEDLGKQCNSTLLGRQIANLRMYHTVLYTQTRTSIRDAMCMNHLGLTVLCVHTTTVYSG